MKRFLVLLLCLLMALSPMALIGCGPSGDGDQGGGGDGPEVPDENRTQLYISVQGCGVGYTFAYNLKDAYEALNPTVQVMIDDIPDSSADGPTKMATILSDRQDINFMCNFTMSDFVQINAQSSDLLADITDAVTDGGNESIHSRMYDSHKSYFNLGTNEAPKYFALPWFESFMGTAYDVKLFRDYGLFELKYKGLDCTANTADDAWGPDGVEGTYDDNFPATWEDMKVLLTEMKGENIIPFTWTSYDGYLPSWMSYIQASYEGADNYTLLQTFKGTYKYKDLQGVIHEMPVTEETGYLLATQQGKFVALKTLEYIINNDMVTNTSLATGSNYDNITAQQTYLESFNTELPIAFINEGCYWENEAREYFKEMAKDDENLGYGKREFGFFPWPKYVGSTDIPDQLNPEARTLLAGTVKDLASAVAVKKNSKVLDIAKDFLKFAYSNQGNADFLRDSGMLRPMDYDKSILTEDYFETMTPYQRSIYEVATAESTVRIAGSNRTGLMKVGGDYIKGMCAFNVTYRGLNYSDPASAFKAEKEHGLTPDSYIRAIQETYTQADWISRFFSGN